MNAEVQQGCEKNRIEDLLTSFALIFAHSTSIDTWPRRGLVVLQDLGWLGETGRTIHPKRGGFIDSNSYGYGLFRFMDMVYGYGLWIWFLYVFFTWFLYRVFLWLFFGVVFFLHYDSYGLMLDVFGRIFRWMIFLMDDI